METKLRLHGLKGADIEFFDPSANDGDFGIVAVHLMTRSLVVRLDQVSGRDNQKFWVRGHLRKLKLHMLS